MDRCVQLLQGPRSSSQLDVHEVSYPPNMVSSASARVLKFLHSQTVRNTWNLLGLWLGPFSG